MKTKIIFFLISIITFLLVFTFNCTESGSSSSGGGGGSTIIQHSWTEYNASGIKGTDFPDERFRHDMAFIGNSYIVLFGGLNSSGYNSETWEYNTLTHTWSKINITGTPGVNFPDARGKHKMAYICDSKVILFGGYSGTAYSDTWVYNISTHSWAKMNIPGIEGVNFPNARYDHALAYGGNNIAVLFGGYDNSMNLLNDTWEYNIEANTWSKINTGAGEGTDFPNARTSLGLAGADFSGDTKVVLFGGYDGPNFFSDTWEYDVSVKSWTKINITGTAGLDFPEGRDGHSLSYADGDKIILFGGYHTSFFSDTWEYNVTSNIWTKINIAGTEGIDYPEGRNQFTLAYGGNSNVILFGGNLGSSFSSETWEFK